MPPPLILRRIDGLTVSSRNTDTGVPSIEAPWATRDIVYTALVGPVMLCAMLEWFLQLAAFIYCFVKAFKKAENVSTKVLSILLIAVFTILRFMFLPIMIVTLPLPSQVVQYYPHDLVEFLQWFAFWSFAALLTIPLLCCIYQLVTSNVGRERRIKYVLDERSAPKVVIVMPCYHEKPDILLRTTDSIVDCEYPPSCIHLFMSFDGDNEDELFLNTIEKLGVPLTLNSYPKSIDVVYRGVRITVSRFPHGGKRHCQKRTFKLIDKVYTEYLKRHDNLFVLFIDSDCILDRVCIQNFMYDMELKPGSKRDMLAQTGVITSTTEKNTFITVLQDMEYIHGQLYERSVESLCGAVTCLPGALTVLRFSAFRKMAKYYFADKAEQCEDLFDYGKCHLGEDRWLTHLFMVGAKERHQIQMNTGAFCKTEAVQDVKSLLKQRRRWFLGFITNEVCMLTDFRLWKKYPCLCALRLAQNVIRTTALLFFIMFLAIATTSQDIAQLPVGFMAVTLGCNWALMFYWAAKLGRFKVALYPIMFVANPFFNWAYMVYGIFTAGQRTWGGPRADAGKADHNVTVATVIEQAEAHGDDLNVVPESFKQAAEARERSGRHTTGVPLQPSEHLEGRFAPAERLPNGMFHHQINDSGLTLPIWQQRNTDASARVPLHPRDSFDSEMSRDSGSNSIFFPRRIESFMDTEDTRHYHQNQSFQRPAGGAFFENNDTQSSHLIAQGTHLQANAKVVKPDNEIESKRAYSASTDSQYSPVEEASDIAESKVSFAESHFDKFGPPEPTWATIPTTETQAEPRFLRSPPRATRSPRNRSSDGSQLKIGRSPLSRRSFMRTAANSPPIPHRPSKSPISEDDDQKRTSFMTINSEPPPSLLRNLGGESRTRAPNKLQKRAKRPQSESYFTKPERTSDEAPWDPDLIERDNHTAPMIMTARAPDETSNHEFWREFQGGITEAQRTSQTLVDPVDDKHKRKNRRTRLSQMIFGNHKPKKRRDGGEGEGEGEGEGSGSGNRA